MVVHLGDDVVIRTCDIVMLLDLTGVDAPDTHAFLQSAQDGGIVRRVSADPPKTAVLTQTRAGRMLYLSPISSVTLSRRADFPE
ncbi:MAG: DUF370 domain-containing protein [Clostridia bacterium]